MPEENAKALSPNALVDAIAGAFADADYPGDDRIVSSSTGPDFERDAIKRLLKGLGWRDVAPGTLDLLRDSLPFLSPEGFRFYLPAYMVYCLNDFYRADVAIDNVVHSLTVPCADDLERMQKGFGDYRAGHPEEARALPDDVHESVMRAQADFYDSAANKKFVLDRISGFTAKQSRVIRRYLEYIRDVHGEEFLRDQPQIAIDRFWNKF